MSMDPTRRSNTAAEREKIEKDTEQRSAVDAWLDGIEEVRGDFPLPERSNGRPPPRLR